MNIIFLIIFLLILGGCIWLIWEEGREALGSLAFILMFAFIGIFLPIGKSTFRETEEFTLTKTPSSLILSLPNRADIIITDIYYYINADKVKKVQIEQVRNAWGWDDREEYKLIY